MPKPRLAAKRWSIELEKQVRETLPPAPLFDHRDLEREPFTIDTPPPYPSGRWHIGAVAHYALIDMIARSRRKAGANVHFPWGVDRNGINIELFVERKYDRPLSEWDREEFIKVCEKEIGANTADLESIARRITMSCDFDNGYRTDSPQYRSVTQRSFIELWNKGQIVEELRPNAYDPSLGTTIADAEIYYEERTTKLLHMRWEVEADEAGEEGDEAGKAIGFEGPLMIATTRPELLCACQAVLVHPDDERYINLHDARAVLPLYGRSVPILPHAYADPEFGSGVVMICSFGDTGDVQLFRELGLAPIAAIDLDGRMTTEAGPDLEGLTVMEARKRAGEMLEKAGAIEKVDQIGQKFPICERSKQPIEIILLKEWYVKQTHVVDELKVMVDLIEFHPAKHRQILMDWLDSISIHWPISRRRYYHTEIPLWYCAKCREPHVPQPGPYYRPWIDPAPFDKCTKCGHGDFLGEEKVFDTWMDSSNSNNFVIGYGQDPQLMDRLFPCTIRPQGRDIVRTWLYYTLLKSYLLRGGPGFKHVWITGLGMDERGRKMSKSVGNIIDPDEMLDKFGSEAFRFWIASECTIGDDFRISPERIEGSFKFLQKLFNVSRFCSMFTLNGDAEGKDDKEQGEKQGVEQATGPMPLPQKPPAPLEPVDKWILAELATLQGKCQEGFADFNFFIPATAIRSFVWNLFAPHYLELVKSRAYEGDGAAIWTLHHCLETVLHQLATLTPCFAHHIGSQLYGDADIQHSTAPPATDDEFKKEVKGWTDLTDNVTEFNSLIWKTKKDSKISLAAPLPDELASKDEYKVPAELEQAGLGGVLKGMHKLD